LLLDTAPPETLKLVIEKSLEERGRRLPIYSIHRWWSRRYAAIYRFLLASYLTDNIEDVEKYIKQPQLMHPHSKNKVFYEPFMGGGTGLVEAAIAGWDVIGVEINPLAKEIVEVELQIVKSKESILEQYFTKVTNILHRTWKKLKRIWTFNGYIISYIHITRGKIPTWISTNRNHGVISKVLICPKCKTVNFHSKNVDVAICKKCGYQFKVTIQPVIPLGDDLPQIASGWRAYALEIRVNRDNRWRKYLINLLQNNHVAQKVKQATQEAQKLAREAYEILSQHEITDLYEGKRLEKEGGFKTLADIYTPKQLLSFALFVKNCRKYLNKNYWKLAKIAISDAAKSSSLISKWYPPIGEPIPAAAMKTYWIPIYTVETNPLAHVPGTLRTLARNTIASAINAQKRAVKYIKQFGHPNNVTAEIYEANAVEYIPNREIDLAVLDPPYLGRVKSYASLSIVHYGIYSLFTIMVENRIPRSLKDIEKEELCYDRTRYCQMLMKILESIRSKLKQNGRIVIMYNMQTQKEWDPLINAIRNANLYPTAIYWSLGETPGKLARSKLRGIFLVILAKTPINHTHVIFEELLQFSAKRVKINQDIERQAFNAMLTTFKKYFIL